MKQKNRQEKSDENKQKKATCKILTNCVACKSKEILSKVK